MISSLNGWYLGMLHHWICRKILHDIVAWSRSLLSGSNCTKSLGSAARWDVGTTPNRKLLVNWRLPIKKRMIRMVSSNSSIYIYVCVCRYLGDRWIGMDCPASKLLSRPRAGPWDFFLSWEFHPLSVIFQRYVWVSGDGRDLDHQPPGHQLGGWIFIQDPRSGWILLGG